MSIQINGTSGISGVDGTASTPALQGTDSNTGISFGTDEVKIVTGGNDRVTVDSSGNVGLGTSSPSSLLHISGSSAGMLRTDRSTDERNHYALATQGTIRGYIGATSANCFEISDNAGASKVTVTNGGNVGIGTTSPSSYVAGGNNLVVNGSGAIGLTIASSDSSDTTIFFADGTTGTEPYRGLLRYEHDVDNMLVYTAAVERARIDSSGSLFAQGVYNDTTAQAATVHVGSDGHLYRSTSSIRYKKDVETLQDAYADAILDCRPVWYRSTTGNDNPDHGYWGFIAEEVAEIDPRLVHWRTTESVVQEDGNRISQPCDPEPEGVQYDRFVPHLLNLIKRQKEQIEAQGTAIAALEARLTALEGGTAQ